ncbi:sulfotransferase family 2 domain-containing protein [Nocardioides litoris]|uniref:sulfotransferase family 2 domain-containing protein n=1 Tax=Nocardioides litoris TaxID=1926648 RepID=UPI00111D7B69|nr:sulfotransferase family 2 domain-containing protein [Nocardioides litoris]
MIIAPTHGFVLLAVPKVASTSLDAALGHLHEPPPGRPPHKHQNLLGFHRHTAPRIEAAGHPRSSYEVVALFRDPVAWLESWWRYRQRPLVREERSTGDLAFAEFVRLFLDDKDATGIKGRPARFIAGEAASGARLDRLFAVDRPEVWTAWFSERVGAPVEVPRRNASTARRAEPLPDDLAVELRAWFAPEYAVLAELEPTGEWQPPVGYRPPGLS